jgi:RND family efflux transporter MFP subunit
MQRAKIVLIVLTMMLICAVLAIGQPPPAKVVVAKVYEKEIVRTNQMVGIVDFDKQSGISTEVSGLIEQVSIVEGTVVDKGAVLAKLNTDFIRKNIEISVKQVEQVEIQIKTAEKDLKRFATLYKKSATSERNYDDLLGTYRERVKEREIMLINIEKLKLEMRKSTIRAPFRGLILQQFKYEGEWISPEAAICTLASTDDVFVKVAVAESLIRFVKPGDEVTLTIDALENEIRGTIHNFVPVADIYFKEILQNMSATVHVPVSHKKKLRMIKRDALIRNQGKDFVYTIKDGKAKILPVNIVGFDGEFVGVDNPYIVPGMPVVIDGNDRLRPDQPVQIVKKAI